MHAKALLPLPARLLDFIDEALAAVIRRHREQLRLTVGQLAARAGLSRQTIGYVEDDKRRMSQRSLGKVAAVFGLGGGALRIEAECWLRRLPACCQKCHNCDVHRGELVCFNKHRGCPGNKQRKLAD